MEENGNENGDNTGSKRDEKGRFVKGGTGGPGRGKSSNELDLDGIDFWEGSKQLILQNMSSKNENTSLKATALYMKWKAMKDEYEAREKEKVQHIITPEDLARVSILQALSRSNMDVFEVKEKVLKFCSKCEKIGPVRKFDFPCDQDKDEDGVTPGVTKELML